MKIDPMAVTAAVCAARILGRDCMLSLFVEPDQVAAVSLLICEIVGVDSDYVRYSPPTAARRSGVYSWREDGDGKAVDVTLHVRVASANDNSLKEG